MKATRLWRDSRRLLIAVAFAASIGEPARGEVTFSFEPIDGVIVEKDPPETLSVNVTVDAEAVDLRGFSFVLEYDPTYVTPVSVGPGGLLSGASCDHFLTWMNETAVGDSIAVDGASLGCSMSGPGTIVEIRFTGVPSQYGVSPLACRDIRLRNSFNQPLPVICVPGTIQHVEEPIGSTPVTWGRLKVLYR